MLDIYLESRFGKAAPSSASPYHRQLNILSLRLRLRMVFKFKCPNLEFNETPIAVRLTEMKMKMEVFALVFRGGVVHE